MSKERQSLWDSLEDWRQKDVKRILVTAIAAITVAAGYDSGEDASVSTGNAASVEQLAAANTGLYPNSIYAIAQQATMRALEEVWEQGQPKDAGNRSPDGIEERLEYEAQATTLQKIWDAGQPPISARVPVHEVEQ